jgi:tryptophan 2,3-dioxygenase
VLSGDVIEEKELGKSLRYLSRVVEIQRVLIQQIDVIETMTPLDFLDFRDVLIPASGFQSVQFRLLENILGLRPEDRLTYGRAKYSNRLSAKDRDRVEAMEREASIFDLVDRWLARTPFVSFGDYDFWSAYQLAVRGMFERDRAFIANNPTLAEEHRERQLEGLSETERQFEAVTDPARYAELQGDGSFRMSHGSFTAALLINLYRDEPILQIPFRLLSLLVDIDENFSTWRHRHALMVQRMLGSKIGTGGSSGHDYLHQVAHHNKVFRDLTHISTFLIPRIALPSLPSEIVQSMGFRYSAT